MIGTTLVGSAALALLGVLPLSAGFATLGALLMFASMLQQAVVDLLVEGKYAEKMALMPETGSDILTWTWSNYMAANMLGALLIGVLADNVGPRAIYAVAVPFALQIFYPLFKGWLDEERLMVGPDRRPKWGLVQQHAGVFFLALMMGSAAIGLMFVNLMAHDAELLWYSVISSTLLCVMGFYTLPATMAKANLYMFLTNALYIGVSGPANYFYTAPASAADCREAGCQCYVVDGPAFSNTYFITVNGAVGGERLRRITSCIWATCSFSAASFSRSCARSARSSSSAAAEAGDAGAGSSTSRASIAPSRMRPFPARGGVAGCGRASSRAPGRRRRTSSCARPWRPAERAHVERAPHAPPC